MRWKAKKGNGESMLDREYDSDVYMHRVFSFPNEQPASHPQEPRNYRAVLTISPQYASRAMTEFSKVRSILPVMDIFGDHLLYFERGTQRIRKEGQVRLLEAVQIYLTDEGVVKRLQYLRGTVSSSSNARHYT